MFGEITIEKEYQPAVPNDYYFCKKRKEEQEVFFFKIFISLLYTFNLRYTAQCVLFRLVKRRPEKSQKD